MPHTNTINQESVDKIVDAVLCVGVPYMNEGWAKFPKEHTQMLDGFKATKGYKEAREQIKKLLEEAAKKEKLLRLAAELRESELRDKVAAVVNFIDAFVLTKST